MVFTEAEHAHWALHWIKGGVLQMGNCVFLRINEGIRINRVEEVQCFHCNIVPLFFSVNNAVHLCAI